MPDTVGNEKVDYRDEEVVSEEIVTPGPLRLKAQAPRSSHLFVARNNGIEVEDRAGLSVAASGGSNGRSTAKLSAVEGSVAVAEKPLSEQIRVARMQGV